MTWSRFANCPKCGLKGVVEIVDDEDGETISRNTSPHECTAKTKRQSNIKDAISKRIKERQYGRPEFGRDKNRGS